MKYLKLTRPINLIMIIVVQLVLKFGFLAPFGLDLALNTAFFLVLVLATVLIAAAGNVINDIFDVRIDLINKPDKVIVGKSISEKQAYNFYILLNILGVGAGFVVANHIEKPALSAVFIIISALLYIYAYQLKSALLVGNLLISVLVAMSLWIVILIDIYPMLNIGGDDEYLTLSVVIFYYGICAFYLNLIREIVKDLEDINGDKKGGRKSIPILIGRQRTVNIIFTLGVIALVGLLIFTYQTLYRHIQVAFYFVFLIGAPLLFFCIRAWSSKTKKDFHFLSITLKVIMLLGIGSLIAYRYSMI